MKVQSRRHFLSSLLVSSGMVLFKNATGAVFNFDDGMIRWDSLQADQLETLIGQSFSIYGVDTKSFDEDVETSCEMTLEAVHISAIDPGRPDFLVRKQSFIAKLIPTWGNSCILNDQIVKIAHPDIIGEKDLFLMAKTDKHESPFLELIFN